MKKFARRSHLLLTLNLVVPDGIPMEFFKALISGKNDSEESSENNSYTTYGFKSLKGFINRI